VRPRVGGISELIHVERAWGFTGETLRHVLVVCGVPTTNIRAGNNNLGAERANLTNLLLTHFIWDDKQEFVSLKGRYKRQS
jgi:hypothetical protein